VTIFGQVSPKPPCHDFVPVASSTANWLTLTFIVVHAEEMALLFSFGFLCIGGGIMYHSTFPKIRGGCMFKTFCKAAIAVCLPAAIFAQTTVLTEVKEGIGSDIGGSYMSNMSATFDMTGKVLINQNVATTGLTAASGISIAETMWCQGWGYIGDKYSPYASVPCNEQITNVSVTRDGNQLTVKFDMFHNGDNRSSAAFSVQIAYYPQQNPEDLIVYNNALVRGSQNYLFTGDGPNAQAGASFNPLAAEGANKFMSVVTPWTASTPGTHVKLMLFANGNAAGYNGIDLSQYRQLKLRAKCQANAVKLAINIGSADDLGMKNLGIITLGTAWQDFTFDISDIANRSDINSLLEVVMHKAYNPVLPAGSSLQFAIDEVRFVK
jgi:hypothetical protein